MSPAWVRVVRRGAGRFLLSAAVVALSLAFAQPASAADWKRLRQFRTAPSRDREERASEPHFSSSRDFHASIARLRDESSSANSKWEWKPRVAPLTVRKLRMTHWRGHLHCATYTSLSAAPSLQSTLCRWLI
jgi:hypothetical protein